MIGRGGRLRGLMRDTRGLALVEFAFAAPILVLLFVGGYQISDAVFAYRKVTATARTIADLTSQYTSVTNASLDTILNVSQQVLTPYQVSSAEVRVSQISINNGGGAVLNWSRAKNTQPYDSSTFIYVPAAYKQNNTTIIIADVTYHYIPNFASSLIGKIDLKEQVTMYPRKSTTITYTAS